MKRTKKIWSLHLHKAKFVGFVKFCETQLVQIMNFAFGAAKSRVSDPHFWLDPVSSLDSDADPFPIF